MSDLVHTDLAALVEQTRAWDIYRNSEDVRHFCADLLSQLAALRADANYTRYRWVNGPPYWEPSATGEMVRWTDVAPRRAEPLPHDTRRCADLGNGLCLHVYPSGRCECGALPSFKDSTMSNVPLAAGRAEPLRGWPNVKIDGDHRWVESDDGTTLFCVSCKQLSVCHPPRAEPPPDRVMELTRDQAMAAHWNAGVSFAHVGEFAVCPHRNCVRFRSAAELLKDPPFYFCTGCGKRHSGPVCVAGGTP